MNSHQGLLHALISIGHILKRTEAEPLQLNVVFVRAQHSENGSRSTGLDTRLARLFVKCHVLQRSTSMTSDLSVI